MDFTLHRNFSELDPGEWNSLLQRAYSNNPFLRYEYQAGWWNSLGGGEWKEARLLIIAARQGPHLVGIAPLFQASHEGRLALLLVGSIEISDYLDLIITRGSEAEFISGLLDHLSHQSGGDWQALDWYNIASTSPALPVLQSEAGRRGWQFSQEIFRPTPCIPLPRDFDSYLAALDKKNRHEIRRKLRRIEEGGNQVRWYISDGSKLDSEIDSLFSLMQGDPAKIRFLTDAMRTHLRAMIHAAYQAGWLWLAFLEINDRMAAAALNFDYGGRLWGYNSGVERDFLELSPGWVLLTHSLHWAIENGRTEFDFMRGGEDYKYRFGAVERHVVRALVIRG